MKKVRAVAFAALLLALCLLCACTGGMLPSTLEVTEGGEETLEATGFEEGDEWVVLNDAVAVVEADGATATVRGVGIGTTEVHILRDGKTVGTCTVNVVLPPLSVFLPEGLLVLKKGGKASVRALMGVPYEDDAEWTTSDRSVASVEGNGLTARVVAVGTGSCTMTVRASGYEASFTVTVA